MKIASENMLMADLPEEAATVDGVMRLARSVDISDVIQPMMVGETEMIGYRCVDIGEMLAMYYPLDAKKSFLSRAQFSDCRNANENKEKMEAAIDLEYGLSVFLMAPHGDYAKGTTARFVVCPVMKRTIDGEVFCVVNEYVLASDRLDLLKTFCRFQAGMCPAASIATLAHLVKPSHPTQTTLLSPITRFFTSQDKMPFPPVTQMDDSGCPIVTLQEANIEEILDGLLKATKPKDRPSKRSAFGGLFSRN